MAYSVTLYLLDISRGMDEVLHDEQTGRDVSKLDLGKEYIMRKLAPKVRTNELRSGICWGEGFGAVLADERELGMGW